MLITLDIFISLFLLVIPFFCFYMQNKNIKTENQTFWMFIKSNKVELSIDFLIGLFFAFTYIAFRYLHNSWGMFSFIHVYMLLLALILPFALAYLCKNSPKSAYIVAFVMAFILFLSPMTRPIFLPLGRNDMNTIADWDMAIPFNLCNISAFIYIIAIITKNKILLGYMISFGMAGGIINNIQAHNTFRGFWYYTTWESYFMHILIIVIPIFMLLTNQIKPNLKNAAINIAWIFPFFLLAGFVINPLWNTNFHFTRPNGFTEQFLPTMQSPWIIFDAYVDPFYMVIFMSLIFAVVALIYSYSLLMYKSRVLFHFQPSQTNDQISDTNPTSIK